jgi:hypothetical protein
MRRRQVVGADVETSESERVQNLSAFSCVGRMKKSMSPVNRGCP